MNFKKYLIKFSLILILFSTFVEKSFSLEPEKFVQSVVDEASLVLTKNFSKEQKIEKLRSIAKRSVDIKGIGFYTLGAHRKILSDDPVNKIAYPDISSVLEDENRSQYPVPGFKFSSELYPTSKE